MPKRVEAMRAWLRQVLASTHFVLEPASDDASFRRYFRVHVGQKTYVVMDAPPDKENCETFVYVAALLMRAGVNVPDVLCTNFQHGFVLLTDLGSWHYLDVLHEGNVGELYADAFHTLLQMQGGIPAPSVPSYSETLLHAEMQLFIDWFLERHLQLTLTSGERTHLLHSFDFLCRSALEQPRVFVHRDYHSRNLMVQSRNNPGVLDFQDAVAGPITYDLVSLLRDVYICWPTQHVHTWVLHYHQLAVECGILKPGDPQMFAREFDFMGVQRHLKVAGIFARLYYRDGKSRYLKDIPQALRYLFEVCARYPELMPLHELFHRWNLWHRCATHGRPSNQA
jgi:aminoglycoside/choline kinase family phosphotransferase